MAGIRFWKYDFGEVGYNDPILYGRQKRKEKREFRHNLMTKINHRSDDRIRSIRDPGKIYFFKLFYF